MKKRYVILITGAVLSLALFAYPTYAMDKPTQPTIPQEQTEESVNEYNSQVDIYNSEVDEYNKQVDEDYERQVVEQKEIEEYNKNEQENTDKLNKEEEEKVATHNTEEDAKVEQNKQDLAQYEQDLAAYEQEYTQYEADLKNEEIVKTYYNAQSTEDYNMKIFQTPDEEEYQKVLEQAVDRRIVREENTNLKGKETSSTIEVIEDEEPDEETYTVTVVHSFYNKNYSVLHSIEEEKEVNKNDVVIVKSIAYESTGTKTVLNSNKYGIFYFYINDEYLSYYWYETYAYSEYTPPKDENGFVNTSNNTYGDYYEICYKGGVKNYGEKPYVYIEYNYFPYLTINKPIEPEKPEEVVEYTPDYWEVVYKEPEFKDEIIPVKGEYLSKLDYLTYEQKEEKELRPSVTPSPEPDKNIPTPTPATLTPHYKNNNILIAIPTKPDEKPYYTASPVNTSDNNDTLIKTFLLIIILAACGAGIGVLLYYKNSKAGS